ncbi:MAG: S1 RNA-binding domain-containing protein [Tissierellia bacterium]|nr:S1 RNA-binding domain-containing protein [Tissierellia bacterium]
MSLTVGSIVEGKVTGMTNFGAFVELPGGKNGLVHISEVSHEYVEKVSDHLKKDQEVKVKVLSMSDDGKIGLSIKQTIPAPVKSAPVKKAPAPVFEKPRARDEALTFEDKLNRYLKDSNERIVEVNTREKRRKRPR